MIPGYPQNICTIYSGIYPGILWYIPGYMRYKINTSYGLCNARMKDYTGTHRQNQHRNTGTEQKHSRPAISDAW